MQGQPCRLFQQKQAVSIASIINLKPHDDENLVSAVGQDIESLTRQVWFVWPRGRFSTRTEKVSSILNVQPRDGQRGRKALMAFEQEPTELSERRWPALSPGAQKHMIAEFKRWMEEGCCQPKMEPSLLGLDWSSCVTREFPEYAGQSSFWNPPEFISYAFSALDAYATAMLAAHFSFRSLGVLNFTCSLKRSGPASQMHLEFATIPEQGRINPESIMLEMLESFPRLLQTKRIEAGAVFFLEGEGCAMQFSYPGQMVAEASPFLRDRPEDLWPRVTLRLTPTDELRIRAQDILAFLLSSTPVEGNPN